MTQEEKAKCLAYIDGIKAEADRSVKHAESRIMYQKKKELVKASDLLWCMRNGLNDAISERKTSMIQMTNFLRWTETIINVLEEAELYTDPMHM